MRSCVLLWGIKYKLSWLKIIQIEAQGLTTMMAILPPTSPTTVMGGFSFAIITERHRWKNIIFQKILEVCPVTPIRNGLLEWGKIKGDWVTRDLVKNLQKSCKTALLQQASSYHSTNPITAGHWRPSEGLFEFTTL